MNTSAPKEDLLQSWKETRQRDTSICLLSNINSIHCITRNKVAHIIHTNFNINFHTSTINSTYFVFCRTQYCVTNCMWQIQKQWNFILSTLENSACPISLKKVISSWDKKKNVMIMSCPFVHRDKSKKDYLRSSTPQSVRQFFIPLQSTEQKVNDTSNNQRSTKTYQCIGQDSNCTLWKSQILSLTLVRVCTKRCYWLSRKNSFPL